VVEHIDRSPSKNNASNLRWLSYKENRFRKSTIEEQNELGHTPDPSFVNLPIVKCPCKLNDSAWISIGEIDGYSCSRRELSIVTNESMCVFFDIISYSLSFLLAKKVIK
jgi:hypothetical protein